MLIVVSRRGPKGDSARMARTDTPGLVGRWRKIELERPGTSVRLRTFNNGGRFQRGFSLLDMMISTGAGAILMATVMTSFVVLFRAFDAVGNYEDLDRHCRLTLDYMGRDIRQAGALTNWSSGGLWFTNLDGTPLNYTYNSGNLTLSYTNGHTGLYGTLLTNCTYLQFSLFQRRPTNGTMNFYVASNAASAKVIEINFTCVRTNYTTVTDSETIQTAKFVMRN